MKKAIPRLRVRLLAIISLLSSFIVWTPVSSAQGFAIDWWTIGSGGGTITGGMFSISATIGQSIASTPMTNGQFSVTGGFWALPLAVQTPDAPRLTIAPAGPGQARVSWTPNTPGFVLQSSPTLQPAAWVEAPSGATNPALVPATLPVTYYRLKKQ